MARVLVIVGITGDLATHKLLPALRTLCERGELPFAHIVGTSRRRIEPHDVLVTGDPLARIFEVAVLPPGDPRAYLALNARLSALGGEVFFYLAVPAGTAGATAARLSSAGCRGTVLLEKPFGTDHASAVLEAARVREAFGTHALRIDHYLLKPLAERVAAQAPARGALNLSVVAAEAVGVNGRTGYYDAAGALRDMGNHLISLAVASLGAHTPEERLHEMQQLTVVRAARGQYEGYAGEVGHPTQTETFFMVELAHRAHPNLTVALASGKRLSAKHTFVRTPAGEWAEEKDDQDAHVRLFKALATGEHDVFISEAEAIESWRILDAARASWGRLAPYAQGADIETLMG